MSLLAHNISEKKRYLAERMGPPLEEIAEQCRHVIDDADQLDHSLHLAIKKLPHCRTLYIADHRFQQLSSDITLDQVIAAGRGQDLSRQPYLNANVPLKGLVLSKPYQDEDTSKYHITLLQAVHHNDNLKGLLIANFILDEIPAPDGNNQMMSNWRHFKGDPAIRGSLFSQERVDSYLDTRIEEVHRAVETLINGHGVFHLKLHYSSSRITLWLYDEPHNYRLHSVEELLSGAMFSHYPPQALAEDACVEGDLLSLALDQFKALRFADENIYLRSGSVNIINGMVGLNFSCDGTHYIQVQEFVDKSIDFWMGKLNKG